MIARRLTAMLVVLTGPAAAGSLEQGLYDVEWSVTLPHVRAAATGVSTLCLGGPGDLGPLGPNNPLAGCPASAARQEDDVIVVPIACPGVGAAHAIGRFRLRPDGFSGTIDMTMGGKNMTLTEHQRGRRRGPCP